jgi:hypothetical protein
MVLEINFMTPNILNMVFFSSFFSFCNRQVHDEFEGTMKNKMQKNLKLMYV